MEKKRVIELCIAGGVLLLIFFPRVFDLDATRSPDEKRWIANTAGFTQKLAHGQLDQLVRQPHPGITTQWLGALTIGYDDWAVKRLPLVVGQVLLILASGYVFGRLWGKGAGLTVALVLALDPLLYAHTRVYAMDSLLALFSLLSIGLLLLWRQDGSRRYLIAAGVTGAAAFLSKLPGIIILPFTLMLFIYWTWRDRQLKPWLLVAGYWSLAFIIGLVIILPSFGIVPQNVIGDFTELFRSDDYAQLHQFGSTYYLRSLAFFSSPVQWVGLLILGVLLTRKRDSRREQLLILLLFGILFTVEMTLGAKKGDRYILPSFVMLDVTAAFGIAWLYALKKRTVLQTTLLGLATLALMWQAIIIWQTHPHTLAYVNPLTSSQFGERRHGWGEGFRLAADYLNAKPEAHQLKAASYFPNEFSPYFDGETVAMHKHDEASVDYVVLYRAMFERGEDAWETDVLNQYRNKKPEKVITISGVDMIWIHAR